MISVIIPTFNEEDYIEDTILSVRSGSEVEIIVADGGSSDNTGDIAKRIADKFIAAPKGRGPQMNAGAAEAKGDILLFLHADTILPDVWSNLIENVLDCEDVAGGAFPLSISRRSPIYLLISFMVNMRSKLISLPYGDQGIFVKKDLFDKIGGFMEIPIMEDLEMVRAISKIGKLKMAEAPVLTSPRRWEKEGWLKTTIRNQLLLYLYLIGVSPERLHTFYRMVR